MYFIHAMRWIWDTSLYKHLYEPERDCENVRFSVPN